MKTHFMKNRSGVNLLTIPLCTLCEVHQPGPAEMKGNKIGLIRVIIILDEDPDTLVDCTSMTKTTNTRLKNPFHSLGNPQIIFC